MEATLDRSINDTRIRALAAALRMTARAAHDSTRELMILERTISKLHRVRRYIERAQRSGRGRRSASQRAKRRAQRARWAAL